MTSHLAIVREGRLEMVDPQSWREALAKHVGKQIVVEVHTRAEKHSDASRAYWHGVVVEFFRGVWSAEYRKPKGLPPYTKDEAHEVLVGHILGFEDGPLGQPVRKRTRNLTQADYSKLIEDAKAMAWHDYQARIPEPNEPAEGL